MGFLELLFSRRGSTDDDQRDEPLDGESPSDNQPCNISGHDYEGQWEHYSYVAREDTFTNGEFTVRQKLLARCNKCDSVESKKIDIGKFKVTDHGLPGEGLAVTREYSTREE